LTGALSYNLLLEFRRPIVGIFRDSIASEFSTKYRPESSANSLVWKNCPFVNKFSDWFLGTPPTCPT
jgi:hypothetical protein